MWWYVTENVMPIVDIKDAMIPNLSIDSHMKRCPTFVLSSCK